MEKVWRKAEAGGVHRKFLPEKQAAADVAVASIADDITEIGVTTKQAHSIQEAVKYGLLGELAAAEDILASAGFDREIIDGLIVEIANDAKASGRY